MTFQSAYLGARSIDDRVALLREEYRLPQTPITVKEPRPFLGLSAIGRTSIGTDGYEISVIGDQGGFLLMHEFLHVLLAETGRTFDPSHSDEDIASYFRLLKEAADDYLIEREVRRQFGKTFAGNIAGGRDHDLVGQFTVAGASQSALQRFMYGITCRLAAEVYKDDPGVRETVSYQLMGNAITITGFDEFLASLGLRALDSNTPQGYQGVVQLVHSTLADKSLTFSDSLRVSADENAIRAFIECANEMDATIHGALALAGGMRGGRPPVPDQTYGGS